MKKNLSQLVSIGLLGTIVIIMIWMGISINKLNSNVKELEKINTKNQTVIESLQEDNEILKDEVGELTHKINLMNMFE
ncbi:hypothetical protein SDC9_201653 [bioreactor metagenome]|uniref:Uncharacterized protein n=1 Tax=bioreactor metagenome TaxID=1076179 RepID=A0A645J0F2_9ZZZZ